MSHQFISFFRKICISFSIFYSLNGDYVAFLLIHIFFIGENTKFTINFIIKSL